MICPLCGTYLSESQKICPSCGNQLESSEQEQVSVKNTPPEVENKKCPKCGTASQGNFCTNCGYSFQERRCPKCGAMSNGDFCSSCGASLTGKNIKPKSPKNKWIAFALCLFLWFIGAHRFYVGKIGTGILMIVCDLIWPITMVWGLIDLICILINCFDDKDELPLTD